MLNYSSRQIKTYKQVCSSLSFPTSHFLYMLSLTNTWLLRVAKKKKKKNLIQGAVCVINIRGEKEVSLAPWRLGRKARGGDGGKRGCWHKRLIKKWQATWDSEALPYDLIFLRPSPPHLSVTSEATGWAQQYIYVYLKNSLIPDKQIWPAFSLLGLLSYLLLSGKMKTETGSRGQDYFKSSERCTKLPWVISAEIPLLVQIVINNVENIELLRHMHTTAVCVGTDHSGKKGSENSFLAEKQRNKHKKHCMALNKAINTTLTAWHCGTKMLLFDITQLLQMLPR